MTENTKSGTVKKMSISPSNSNSSLDPTGVRYALLAYTAWGFFPLYWRFLQHIPSLEILFHRVIWSWVFYVGLRFYIERKWFWGLKLDRSAWINLSFASIILSFNWLLYIYAVNSGHVVESSLGYFINPLVNVVIGIFLLGEKLKSYHRVSLFFVCLGVLGLTLEAGRPPWIALGLALSFSVYGYLRKQAKTDVLHGSQIESFLMILPILLILLFFQNGFSSYDSATWLYLLTTGLVTGLPLVWFARAARKLPYYMMGFFQYIAPTLQFLTGVLIFHEELSSMKLLCFVLIWMGVAWTLLNSWKRA